MIIIGIDPGPTESGWVSYDLRQRRVIFARKDMNTRLIREIIKNGMSWQNLVIEKIQAQGQRVGQETFDTAFWAGRFAEAWETATGNPAYLMFRREVKQYLGLTQRDKDVNVWAECMCRHGTYKDAAVGTKEAPGPLWIIEKVKCKEGKNDVRQALALILAWIARLEWIEQQTRQNQQEEKKPDKEKK